jgi:hypothetical protein
VGGFDEPTEDVHQRVRELLRVTLSYSGALGRSVQPGYVAVALVGHGFGNGLLGLSAPSSVGRLSEKVVVMEKHIFTISIAWDPENDVYILRVVGVTEAESEHETLDLAISRARQILQTAIPTGEC